MCSTCVAGLWRLGVLLALATLATCIQDLPPFLEQHHHQERLVQHPPTVEQLDMQTGKSFGKSKSAISEDTMVSFEGWAIFELWIPFQEGLLWKTTTLAIETAFLNVRLGLTFTVN